MSRGLTDIISRKLNKCRYIQALVSARMKSCLSLGLAGWERCTERGIRD
jgi:hypothetical protein